MPTRRTPSAIQGPNSARRPDRSSPTRKRPEPSRRCRSRSRSHRSTSADCVQRPQCDRSPAPAPLNRRDDLNVIRRVAHRHGCMPHTRLICNSPSSGGAPQRGLELTTEMMRSDAGLHADQTGWHIGKACLELATQPLLAQYNRASMSWPTMWNEFLPISMPTAVIEVLRHSVLLVFGAPCQLRSLAGQEHGRTIPLADNVPILHWRNG
jgi:hypothetical protein